MKHHDVARLRRPAEDVEVLACRLDVGTSRAYGSVVRPETRHPALRSLYATMGVVLLAVGIAGFVIPGLPGTPLLLVAAWLFSMSSQRLYDWTTTNRWFGQAVADYRAGLGIPRRTKIVAVTMVAIVSP